MDKRQRRILRKNSVLGGFLLVCLVILTILTFRLAGISFKPRQDWTVRFGAESIIKKGYEVICSGTKVGMVKSVRLLPDEEIGPGSYVEAVLTLDQTLTLWQGAEVVLLPRGLLGGFNVVVRRGDPSRPQLTPETLLQGRIESGMTEEIGELVAENREDIRRVIRNLASGTDALGRGEGTLGRILNDEAVYDNLLRASEALALLDSPDSSIGRFLRDPQLHEDLSELVANLKGVSADLRTGKGVFARLLQDEELGNDLAGAVAGARSLLARVERGEGTLGKLLTDDRAYEELVAAVESLRRFAEHIEKGEGTLSRLLTDDEIYANLQILSDNLAAVSTDIRAGKGTLGKLLMDDGAYNELQRMLESFRESGEIARENAPISSLTSFTSLFFNILN